MWCYNAPQKSSDPAVTTMLTSSLSFTHMVYDATIMQYFSMDYGTSKDGASIKVTVDDVEVFGAVNTYNTGK